MEIARLADMMLYGRFLHIVVEVGVEEGNCRDQLGSLDWAAVDKIAEEESQASSAGEDTIALVVLVNFSAIQPVSWEVVPGC